MTAIEKLSCSPAGSGTYSNGQLHNVGFAAAFSADAPAAQGRDCQFERQGKQS
jgi:hypothetical protein